MDYSNASAGNVNMEYHNTAHSPLSSSSMVCSSSLANSSLSPASQITIIPGLDCMVELMDILTVNCENSVLPRFRGYSRAKEMDKSAIEKKRLDNAIWRCWHLHYVKGSPNRLFNHKDSELRLPTLKRYRDGAAKTISCCDHRGVLPTRRNVNQVKEYAMWRLHFKRELKRREKFACRRTEPCKVMTSLSATATYENPGITTTGPPMIEFDEYLYKDCFYNRDSNHIMDVNTEHSMNRCDHSDTDLLQAYIRDKHVDLPISWIDNIDDTLMMSRPSKLSRIDKSRFHRPNEDGVDMSMMNNSLCHLSEENFQSYFSSSDYHNDTVVNGSASTLLLHDLGPQPAIFNFGQKAYEGAGDLSSSFQDPYQYENQSRVAAVNNMTNFVNVPFSQNPIAEKSPDGVIEQRRKAHTASEQKRRLNIKNGFDQLHKVIPVLCDTPRGKVNKIAILERALNYITDATMECKSLSCSISSLKEELAVLNNAVTPDPNLNSYIHTNNLLSNTLSVPNLSVEDQYNDYVTKRAQADKKYAIFRIFMDELFGSFVKEVSAGSHDTLFRTTKAWLETHFDAKYLLGLAKGAFYVIRDNFSFMASSLNIASSMFNSQSPFTMQQQQQLHHHHQHEQQQQAQRLDSLLHQDKACLDSGKGSVVPTMHAMMTQMEHQNIIHQQLMSWNMNRSVPNLGNISWVNYTPMFGEDVSHSPIEFATAAISALQSGVGKNDDVL